MKHKDKEPQQRREAKQEKKKTDLLLFLSFWVVGLSLGETLPGTKGLLNTMKQGFLLFFLFICWSVIGQANDMNNNKNKTTKTRQQNYKRTKNNT